MVIDSVDSSTNYVTEIFPTSVSPTPSAMVAGDYISQYQKDRHSGVGGEFPAISAYEVSNCYIYASGFYRSKTGSFIYMKDVIADYAMDHLRKTLSDDPSHFMNREIGSSFERIEGKKIVVPLGKPGYHVYGHWLLDILPLVWLSQIAIRRIGISENDISYLLPIDCPKWAIGMMHNLFGIDEDQLIYQRKLEEPFFAEEAILLSMTRFNDRIWWGMNLFSEFILDRLDQSSNSKFPKKFFVSRSGIKSAVQRSCLNELEIQEGAVKLGYELVRPENLTLADQVRLFRGADSIIGLFGSGMHNTLFSTPLSNITILGNSHINWIQSSIAGVRGHQIGYVFPETEVIEQSHLIHTYRSNAVLEILAAFEDKNI